MKTVTEAEFFEDPEEFIDHALAEPVEIEFKNDEAVVIISKSLFDAFVSEYSPFLR